MMAITNRILINPPMVYEVIKPKSQRISNITAIVVSMVLFS